MAEILSPNPTKPRASVATRFHSPTSPFFIGSNDDQLERAQLRAARAAAIRRKSMTANAPPPLPSGNCLDRDQIIELFQNCIKLATENKINQKNMWELKLIDHLSEIVTVEASNDSETNFQKASCTLEAGVKIYSLRVDSVHSEAYKVLGRITRAGGEDEEGTTVEGGDTSNGPDESCSKKEKEKEKEKERKISPLSTLEPSFEAFNLKKFDVAFAVDPLYHQTSAQFDEGGAKGLLLNNLRVYGGCRVLFDSHEVPWKCISQSVQDCSMDVIDLSFAREYIEQMLIKIPEQLEISPTLREIVCQFDENSQRSSHTLKESQEFVGRDDSILDSNVHFDSNLFQNFEAGDSDNEGETGLDAGSCTFGDETFSGHYEEDDPCTSDKPEIDGASEELALFVFQRLGFMKKQNVWAGPEHWKFRKPKGAEDVFVAESRPGFTTKRSSDKPTELDIDFMKAMGEQMPDLFAPPKNPMLLLLPANRVPPERTLPEDCHYKPENLVRLFLLPEVMCFAKGNRKNSEDTSWKPDRTSDEQIHSWDTGSVFDGQFDDTCFNSDVEDLGGLVKPHARQVNKIEVQYEKTSKQVDVHVLKETLWEHIQESTQAAEMVYEGTISFKDVLATFPDDCEAAPAKDISPHLCFICLLHLANEHSLSIYDCPTLDDLRLQFPSS